MTVGDELLDLESTFHVILNKTRELRTTLDTTKGRTSPNTTSNQLEGTSRDLLTSSSNTNDNRLTPALVTSLQSTAHDIDITSTVKGEVKTTVSDFNQVLSNWLVHSLGVDEVGSTELGSPFLLFVINVDNNDLTGLTSSSTLNNRQTNTTSTKYSNRVALLDIGSNGSSTITSSDTAT
ncbi:hypothetical protein AWJ20_4462 [Sugiyamaella lignohabitans]|uniref:Uncharacterized protein n=1 Tax=Sugiyamaella lignohabitans TaxID=796027 RepID=A0A161HG29_9ASCO|nr:uncharacterized protein AWJ20_4462 [Sugiyamaella lignohabitans]ANB11641.1 hypothetical protein AWJ20_4462 [Sugiyamaella lignohabitans]